MSGSNQKGKTSTSVTVQGNKDRNGTTTGANVGISHNVGSNTNVSAQGGISQYRPHGPQGGQPNTSVGGSVTVTHSW